MRNVLRARYGAVLTALAVLGLAACGGGDGDGAAVGTASAKPSAVEKELSLNFGVVPASANQWSYYIAQDEGFFAKNKVAPRAVAIQDSNKLTQSLASGALDLAALTPDGALIASANGSNKIVFVGAFVNSPNIPLVTAKEITSVAQLKGKTIGVSALTSSDALFVKEILNQAGIAPSDYKVVAVGGSSNRVAALKRGAIQGTILSPPQNMVAQAGGYNLVATTNAAVPNYVWLAIAANRDYVKQNPEAVKRVLRSIGQATDWFYDPANKAAATAALVKNASLEPAIADMAYTKFTTDKVLSPDVSIDPKGLEAVATFMKAAGEVDISKIPALETFIDSSYLP
jgi:ABC-type nitrate/sulfonate/bicarbonate transport system substrate-binding protein